VRIYRSIKVGVYLSLLITFCGDGNSQTSYSINPVNSKMIIQGTSSLHDWQMEVRDMDCSTKINTDGKKINGIQFIEFSCVPTSIVSDYKLMDKKTYEALKADVYSKIDFKMKKEKLISGSGHDFNGMVTGNLSIAGETKEIEVPFQGHLLDNGHVQVQGTVNLKLSDFNIDPPTAMFGTLKTGDNISIVYSIELDSQDSERQLSEINQ
jgi:polyisoprenoid-binding protein YceI